MLRTTKFRRSLHCLVGPVQQLNRYRREGMPNGESTWMAYVQELLADMLMKTTYGCHYYGDRSFLH
jgi:hypothetical protein